MLKKILFGLVCLTLVTFAQGKEKQIPATGTGATRDMAILNAVENAVRQYNGVAVEKDAPTLQVRTKHQVDVKRDGPAKKDKATEEVKVHTAHVIEVVNAKYKGKVDSYQITKEEKTDDGYTVSIVASFKEVDDYKAGKLAAQKEYSLAVPVFDNKRYTLCSAAQEPLLLDNATFDLKEQLSATRRFKLLDRQNFAAHDAELALIAGGATQEEEVKRLRNVIPADYILVGAVRQFDFSNKKETLDLIGETHVKTQGQLSVEFSLLESATMENVYTTRSTASFDKEGELLGCETVFNNLSAKIARDTARKVTSRLFPSQQAARPVRRAKKMVSEPKPVEPPQKPVVKLPFDK